MKTTMQTLAGSDCIKVILEAFKDGEKQCEIPITKMTPREIREIGRLQEYQGRTWWYKTIRSYKFREI